MQVKLRIPDETYDQYEKTAEKVQATSGKTVTVEELLSAQLDRFAGVSPTDRIVVIPSGHRDRLEQLLGGGSLRSSEDLVSRVESLASISIGDVRLGFTPGQMKQLAAIAQRNRKTVEQVVKETVKEMEWRFFDELRS